MQCLQYQTDQQSDVKKVEKLNNLFFGLMAKGVEDSEGGLCITISVSYGSVRASWQERLHCPAVIHSVSQCAGAPLLNSLLAAASSSLPAYNLLCRVVTD